MAVSKNPGAGKQLKPRPKPVLPLRQRGISRKRWAVNKLLIKFRDETGLMALDNAIDIMRSNKHLFNQNTRSLVVETVLKKEKAISVSNPTRKAQVLDKLIRMTKEGLLGTPNIELKSIRIRILAVVDKLRVGEERNALIRGLRHFLHPDTVNKLEQIMKSGRIEAEQRLAAEGIASIANNILIKEMRPAKRNKVVDSMLKVEAEDLLERFKKKASEHEIHFP